jgi:mannose-6-phosphate isomerase
MPAAIRPDTVVFFEPNRVWRCYRGGALLDRFTGRAEGEDDHFPEDWLASTTIAVNGPNQQSPTEGLSRVRAGAPGEGPLFRDLLAADPQGWLGVARYDPEEGVGVLCKFLDAAVRLCIQCHPDRALARRLYDSAHGKAESWIILDTRPVDGVEPFLLLGFRPGVEEAAFREAVRTQDIEAMVGMLHRVPARAGETYFLPGRFPHAVGSGVFMLEVQEPTDWVIQPEATCAGHPLSAVDQWGPLEPEAAMNVFAYRGEERASVIERLRHMPRRVGEEENATLDRIIGPQTTDCFRVDLLRVHGEHVFVTDLPYHIGVVTDGEGTVRAGQTEHPIRRGDVYFAPHALENLTIRPVPGAAVAIHVIGRG